jgi:replicative DNA helicase
MSALSPFEQEQGVLCAALADVASWQAVTRALTPRDFADERHQHVMAALMAAEPAGRSVDVIAVFTAVRAKHGQELVDYVQRDLLDAVPHYGPLPSWIARVVEASIGRRTVAALETAARAVTDGEPREGVEHTLEQKLAAIRASAPDARVFDDKALMAAQALAYLDDEARGGTPYGFAPLDAVVLPPQPSHLVLVGGASGAGKSAVARNMLRQMVQRYQRTVGWLTCEMSGEEQLVHLACIDARVPLEDYYRRRLRHEQRARFTAELTAWKETPLLRVNEMGSVTPAMALSIFRRWREQGVTHFVLDHLHRLDYGAVKSGDDLRVPVAAFAKALKNFAKDSEATVYALVQYSKIKPHEEPSDDKIREANNVLEEADVVFHIYRPHVACEPDAQGILCPLTKPTGGRYFEHDAPKGSTLAPDREAVYVKLGKQRRRLRDGLVRIPFNHELAVMYDSARPDASTSPFARGTA